MVIGKLLRMQFALIAGVHTAKNALKVVRNLAVKNVIQDTCLEWEIVSSVIQKLLTINA